MNEADVLEEFEIERLSEAYLPGADLYEANLSGVDLSGANLCDCDLVGADLSGANLSGANLSGANLFGANLSKANLSRADLTDCSLRGANLSRADLSLADLSGANLAGANLSWANFAEADLSGADLSNANLYRTNLTGVTGLASTEEEMTMLVLLSEQIRQEAFEFNMGHWHGGDKEIFPDESSFESLLNTCGTTHCAAGYCQVKLAEEGHPLALISAGVAGSYAIPSMARCFASSEEKFIEYLDDFISGKESLLQR